MPHDKKILIVEDEEINRAILNEMFYRNYDALEATNGQEALELIEQHRDSIAVILLDVIMPVMDGVQFMEEMHRRDWIKDIPIVLITAEVSDKLSIQSYEFGISDVISKPFNPYIVKLRVGNIIELNSYRKNLEQVIHDQTIELQIQAEKLRQSNSFFIEALNTAVEFRDNESGMHIQRIRDITRLFLYNVSERYPEYSVLRKDADLICDAAAMHDIGKIAIPDAILLKPGRLTKEEFDIMKTHSLKGCEILDKLSIENSELLGYCYDICRHHHERWDGRGYPDGLSGNNISIWAQIVSIADVYDALVSKRVYKDARSHEKALEMIINGECGVFNPMLLECLEEMAQLLRTAYEDGEIFENSLAKRDVSQTGLLKQADSFQPVEDNADRVMRLLEIERKKHQIAVETVRDILFEYDRKTDSLLFEERFQNIFNRDIKFKDVQNTLLEDSIFPEESKTAVRELMEFMAAPEQSIRRQLQMRSGDGTCMWYEIYLYALWEREEGQQVCEHIMGKLTNIEKLKKEAAVWQEKAFQDDLTGLYNMAGVMEKAEELFGGSAQKRVCYFVDIDNFKEINDKLGYLGGNQLLLYLAGKIKNCFRSTDVIAHIGGDKFMILAVDLPQHLVTMKAEKLCGIFRYGYMHNDCKMSISASVGIAYYPEDAADYESLFKCADAALRQAKQKGKNGYAYYKS